MPRYPKIPYSVIRRLPRYYRYLGELSKTGVERISSREFADKIGLTASQIRQDLNCFGGFGQQGYGYNVAALRKEIGRILSLEDHLPAILLGAGNLGLAIANHMSFEQRGFNLVGIFDKSPAIIGKKIREWTILDVKTLEEFCEIHKPKVAVMCVPTESMGELSDTLVSLGIKGFWNFTHYDLSLAYKDEICVENVHLSDSLMTLGFYIHEKE